MDNAVNIQLWDKVIFDLNREEENADRRYRRYNKSYDAIGENVIQRLSTRFNNRLSDIDSMDRVTTDFCNNIENDWLFYALTGLNSDEMFTIFLVYDKGLSFSEIAMVTNTNYDSVQKRHYRAIKKLKKNFGTCPILPSQLTYI
jgi:RNA polymerase sigma factor (sigma-70 family)